MQRGLQSRLLRRLSFAAWPPKSPTAEHTTSQPETPRWRAVRSAARSQGSSLVDPAHDFRGWLSCAGFSVACGGGLGHRSCEADHARVMQPVALSQRMIKNLIKGVGKGRWLRRRVLRLFGLIEATAPWAKNNILRKRINSVIPDSLNPTWLPPWQWLTPNDILASEFSNPISPQKTCLLWRSLEGIFGSSGQGFPGCDPHFQDAMNTII